MDNNMKARFNILHHVYRYVMYVCESEGQFILDRENNIYIFIYINEKRAHIYSQRSGDRSTSIYTINTVPFIKAFFNACVMCMFVFIALCLYLYVYLYVYLYTENAGLQLHRLILRIV